MSERFEKAKKWLAVLDGFRMCGQMDHSAYSSLYNMISVLDVPEWISVKDRSPDMKGTYLVVRKRPTRAVTLAWYSGEYGWLSLDGDFYADGVITHFMPMPEPPKEEP